MAWPGYPDSFDPGWWDEVITTPPVYSGTGTLATNSTAVTGFSATFQEMAITPILGQQVSGTGIPTNTTIASVTNSTDFTLSAAATNSGAVTITVGAEPVSVAEAKAWARVENSDDDSLIADIIQATREWAEGIAIKRACVLQGVTYYAMGFPWTGGYYNRLIRSMGPNPWWLPTAQGIILMPRPNLQRVVALKYIDPSSGNLLEIPLANILSSSGQVPSRVMPQYGTVWPLARPVLNAVQITYATGYGRWASDVPMCVRLGMRAVIAASYENREAFMEGAGLTVTPMAEKMMNVEYTGGYW